MVHEATRRSGTPVMVTGLRVLLVIVVILTALLGVVDGALITDACPSADGCSQVEAFALGHVPLQVIIGVTGLVVSLRLAQRRAQIVTLLGALTASPVSAVVFHSMVVAYMHRLGSTG